MIKTICLGIGLNMFFPERLVLVDAPPTVKELFFSPGFNSRKKTRNTYNHYTNKYSNRTTNK